VSQDGEVFVGRPAHTITHNILRDDGPMVPCPDLASERESVAPRRYEPIPVS
jgi:hypothetical protein